MARHYRFFFPVASALMLFCSVFAHPAAVRAEDPLFTVSGVRVDVTAESAVKARAEAFEKAQQDAFKMLADRLLPEEDAQNFVPPASATISPMVRDFEITGEQLSRVQYIGTYTFRFKENAIRNFFADKNVSFTSVRSKPVLILPFYQAGTKTILWGESNPWLAAWGRTDTRQGLVPVQVPIGDIADVADISDTQALTYNAGSLHNMIGRYGAGEAIILIGKPKAPPAAADSQADAAPPESMDIMVYRTDLGAPSFVKTINIAASEITGSETLFDAAVRLTRQAFQSDWKNKTSVQMGTLGEKATLNARVRFSSLREWSETQKALRKVSAISYMRVVRLSPKQAEIELTYSGPEDRLRLALAQSDITLSNPQDPYGEARYGYQPQKTAFYDLYLNPPRLPSDEPQGQ